MTLNKPTDSGRDSHARTAPALFENQSGHLIAYADGDLIAIGQRLQALGRKLAKDQTTK